MSCLKKIIAFSCTAVLMSICMAVPAGAAESVLTEKNPAERDSIYQLATISALVKGVYDGAEMAGSLLEKGDFGVGTYENLDGEMIVMDGVMYQVPYDGVVRKVDQEVLSPFAMITYFDKDMELDLTGISGIKSIQEKISSQIINKNAFYAIRIDGEFSYVKTRSVPAQAKPYPPLALVTEKQSIFEMKNVKGTLIGYWCPAFMDNLNVPGYHLHFITDDKKAGGHLLDASLLSGTMFLDQTDKMNLVLPETEGFVNTDISGDVQEQVQKSEN